MLAFTNGLLRKFWFSSLVLLLGGCWSTTPDNEPKEVVKVSLSVSTADQLRLLKDAQDAYEKELYTIAKENFEKLKNSYPLGPYSEFAQIKIADSYFAQGQYSSAATNYAGFIKEHPASTSYEYALIKAGRSFQLSNRGAGRDPTSLLSALEFYNRVLQEFPGGIYQSQAQEYLEESRTTLALHEQRLLDYYRSTENTAAYSKRLEEFKIRWADLISSGQITEP